MLVTLVLCCAESIPAGGARDASRSTTAELHEAWIVMTLKGFQREDKNIWLNWSGVEIIFFKSLLIMAHPVSLALGIAGLVAPVFRFSIAGAYCASITRWAIVADSTKAIHFIIDIRNIQKDQKYLVLSLRLEEQKLLVWGGAAGLLVHGETIKEDKPDDAVTIGQQAGISVCNAHRGLVLDLLVQINVLFEDFRKQQLRQNRLKEAKEEDEATRPDASAKVAISEPKQKNAS